MKNFLGFQIKELSDPVQTHAAYNVPYEQIPNLKEELKKQLGAKNFRTVNPLIKGMKILCFKLEN